MADQPIFTGEVLEDGTIKTTTGKIGAQFHQAAEAFMKMIAQLTGGKTTIATRGDAHTHTHHHGEQTHSH